MSIAEEDTEDGSDWNVAVYLEGPATIMNVHLKAIRELAALTDWGVRIEEARSNNSNDTSTARIRAEVHAIINTYAGSDAMMMLWGLCSVRNGSINAEGNIAEPYFLFEEP